MSTKVFKKAEPPTTEKLWRGTKEALIIYILSESDSDCETMEANNRYTLLTYCNYLQAMRAQEESIMPFELWVNSSPEDIQNYSHQ